MRAHRPDTPKLRQRAPDGGLARLAGVGLVFLALLALLASLIGGASGAPSAAEPEFRVLVFTKTAAFRHSSIPTAVRAVEALGERNRIAVDATDDAAQFTQPGLSRYAAVVFLLTTGDVLDPAQQDALRRYVRAGGGFVGVHSAADTEHGWPWYGRLVGARFASHPPIQPAAVDVVDRLHPSTRPLSRRWLRTDEWYNFAGNPRGSVRVLATLDESSYQPGDGAMGRDHPIAWSHALEGGRAWYTAGGHTEETYAEPLFLAHLLGGIRYAAKVQPPHVTRLALTVRGRRVSVEARYVRCRQCAATLRVGAGSRSLVRTGQARNGLARATSPVLAAGRRRVSLTLEDLSTARRTTVQRIVQIG